MVGGPNVEGRAVVGWDDYFCGVAAAAARRSKDGEQAVGACVASPGGQVLGTGYNGPPRGADDRLLLSADRALWIVHAEENALLAAVAALGAPPEGRTLYSTHRPCARCLRLAAHLLVRRAVYAKDTLRADQRADSERAATALKVRVEALEIGHQNC